MTTWASFKISSIKALMLLVQNVHFFFAEDVGWLYESPELMQRSWFMTVLEFWLHGDFRLLDASVIPGGEVVKLVRVDSDVQKVGNAWSLSDACLLSWTETLLECLVLKLQIRYSDDGFIEPNSSFTILSMQ
jgi:hypothetical protein